MWVKDFKVNDMTHIIWVIIVISRVLLENCFAAVNPGWTNTRIHVHLRMQFPIFEFIRVFCVFLNTHECSYSFTPAVNRNRLQPNALNLSPRKTIQEKRVRWKIIRNTTMNHVMMGHVFRQRVVHRSKSLFYQSSFCRSAYMQLLLRQEWTQFRVGHIHGSRNDTFQILNGIQKYSKRIKY